MLTATPNTILNMPPVTSGTALKAQMTGSRVTGYSPYPAPVPDMPMHSRVSIPPGIAGEAAVTPSKRYFGTGGKGGPNRNDIGLFRPQFGGEGVPGEVYAPSSSVKQVTGFRTNERVHYQSICDPQGVPYDHTLSRQQYLFARTGSGPSGLGTDPIYVTVGEMVDSSKALLAINLPTLNFLLASEASAQLPDATARSVLSKYFCAGPVYAEAGTQSNDGVPRLVLGFSRRGPEQTYNVWGNDVQQYTELYLVVKMMDRPEFYCLDPTNSTLDAPVHPDGHALRTRCMQVLPWASKTHGFPSLEDVKYIDNSGNVCYGSVVRVGRVEFTTTSADPRNVMAAPFSTAALIGCQDFNVLFDQPRIHHFG